MLRTNPEFFISHHDSFQFPKHKQIYLVFQEKEEDLQCVVRTPGNCNSFSPTLPIFLPRHGPRASKFFFLREILFSLVQREGNFGTVKAKKKPLFRCFQDFLKLFRILLTTCLGKQVNVAPVSKRKAKKKTIERIRRGRDFLPSPPPPHLNLPQIRKHFTPFFLSLARRRHVNSRALLLRI